MKKVNLIKISIVGALILITLSFLILQKGIWNYLDTFWLNDINNILNIIKDSVNIWSTNTYFGYDNSLNAFFRFFLALYSYSLIYIFGIEWGQVLYYGIYFTLIFIFSSKFYRKIYKHNEGVVFVAALLTSFNPLTVWLMNTSTGIYSVPGFFILMNSLHNFLKYKVRFLDILGICIGLGCMITYGRLLIIFLILVFVYSFIISLKEKKKINFKKISFLALFLFFIFIPLFFLLGHQKIIDSEYTSSLFNYFQSNQNFAHEFQSWLKYNYTGFEQLIFKFHTSNLFQTDNIVINILYLIIIFSFIFTFFLKVKNKRNTFHNIIAITFILFLGTQFLYLLPTNLFSIIVYKSMFLSGNLYWGKFLIFFLFLFLVAEVLLYYKSGKVKVLFYTMIACFIALSIFPTTQFINDFKLQKIDYTKLGKYYGFSMGKRNINQEGTIFFPETEAIFGDQPYPVKYNYHGNLPAFSDNKRLVNDKQSFLKSVAFNPQALNANISLFNIKNIFTFKNLKTNNYGVEWYSTDNENIKNQKIHRYLSKADKFYTKQNNKDFSQFGIKDDDKYEFFLYAPSSIERKNIKAFFSEKPINIKKKPINIDSESFHKPSILDIFEVPKKNRNIFIKYKRSILQPTKIYARLENIDIDKSFLIQLNQTFGMSWKVKWITKQEFNEKNCINEYRDFSITQNKYCNYKAQILDIRDTKYLFSPALDEARHFEGNFVGNAWLIKPTDIPKNMRGQKELYIIIIYEKQIWYNLALVISGITFLFLLIATIFQEIKLYSTRKK